MRPVRSPSTSRGSPSSPPPGCGCSSARSPGWRRPAARSRSSAPLVAPAASWSWSGCTWWRLERPSAPRPHPADATAHGGGSPHARGRSRRVLAMGAELEPPSRVDLERQLAEGPGFVVLRQLVDADLVDAALRRLNLEILRVGLTAEQIDEWKYATFWPTLRWEPEVLAAREPMGRFVDQRSGEEWGDSQLLLRFPDEAAEWSVTPHVDHLPEWAGGRAYKLIFGLAL